MSGNSTKDWAEAHWAPLTGEKTELTQFNIWHHRRFGFVDHRDAACRNRWLAWTASREVLVIELPTEQPGYMYYAPDVVEAIEAAGLKVKP
ncbi:MULTISPECIES: hypothetical protein [unclassified Pseudomonas]|jgi:hypothetical protein|uniref:hypothetical protein n=1 Tax=unclassified Pseudomonas TaxID=196821 RepID=UPI000C884056|nr:MULTISPECIES: hypothetical protein [unclassified Pseudomonas]MBL1311255.1 hypothetical protein [Pseudomonas sp.]PMX19117.1 hypothetical protein C1Y25_00500 [Pseudomonas sp. MPBC4-3]PMX50078.1 hypothetical protein C1Y20_04215 [Pseudomonas sp. FW301-21B01]PMY10794.1 hypothetical protein C1Y18_02045 [Pseudomonas sp. MPR-R5A]PNA72961.1 hypothetical protein C1Y14_01600 [Pseudomonas sp. MPR-R5B]